MKRNSFFSLLLSGLLGLGLVSHRPAAAAPGHLTVTTTADEMALDGNCSLREAIQAVNSAGAVDSCGPAGAVIIELAEGIYPLTRYGFNEDANQSGDLDIHLSLTLQGAGAGKTIIDGAGLDRVLQIFAGSEVLLSGVTVRNGTAPDGQLPGEDGGDGGGIHNAGSLTLLNSTVLLNTAGSGSSAAANGGHGGRGGGIFSSGTLSLQFSAVSFNKGGSGGYGDLYTAAKLPNGGSGGGIYSSGALSLLSSRVDGNLAGNAGQNRFSRACESGLTGQGGGIYSAGPARIEASTLSANAAGVGSCDGNGGDGGGLYNAGEMKVISSTVSANFSGEAYAAVYFGIWNGGRGGGIFNRGDLALESSTIAGNTAARGQWIPTSPVLYGWGGGIASTWEIQLHNTIVANNTGDPAAPDCSGYTTVAGANLIRSLAGCNLQGDQSGMISGVDPFLWPLQDNGGPTPTRALAPGSPAIDAGSCTDASGSPLLTDQRGFARQEGPGCDLGAVEAAVFLKLFVPVQAGAAPLPGADIAGPGRMLAGSDRPTPAPTNRAGVDRSNSANPRPGLAAPGTDGADSADAAQAATTTSLTSSLNPSIYGEELTFTATVSAEAGTPAEGTVTFKFENQPYLSAAPVALGPDGKAAFSTADLNAGNQPVSASYSGGPNYAASSGLLAGGQQVARRPAAITFGPLGQSYTGKPARFVNARYTLVNGFVSGVKVWYGLSAWTPTDAGSYPVRAVLSEDDYIGSAVETLVIQKAGTEITLRAGPAPVVEGQPAVFSVRVSSPEGAVPTGKVLLTVFGMENVLDLDAGGEAVLVAVGMEVGEYPVRASYPGGPNFLASGPAELNLKVEYGVFLALIR